MKERLELRDELDGHVYWIHGATPRDRPLHTHEELELNLVVSGEAEYLVDGARVRLVSGSLLWLFPSQGHALSTSSNDFEMWVYVFRPRLLDDACRTQEFAALRDSNPSDRVSTQLFPSEFERLTRLCRETRETFDQNADVFNASLRYLLANAWLATLRRSGEALPRSVLHPGVFKAALALCRNPAEASLADLARKVGMSPEHLSRLFKSQMGQTLADFRNDQRLRLFGELRASGRSMTLLEATLAAGFGSYAQFYRVHKSRTGKAPSEGGR